MSELLPPSTNGAYRGAPAAAWFLALLGIGWIGPGLLHSFLTDGGASSIAGIDLGDRRGVIVAAFAWAGATQIAHGVVLLVAALRYRSLVPLLLLVSLGERALLATAAWVTKTAPGGHHPPEHYGSAALVPAIAVFLALSLRPRAG